MVHQGPSVNPWIKLYKEKKSSALEKAKESGIEEIIEIIRSRGAGIDECFKISKFKNKKDLVAGIGKGFSLSMDGRFGVFHWPENHTS